MKFKNILKNMSMTAIATFVIAGFAFVVPVSASQTFGQAGPAPAPPTNTNKTAVCEGVGFASGQQQSNCDTGNPQGAISGVVKAAIDLISIVVGVIAVVMIIIGGLKYIMSSGDSNNINSAKNTILYAIIGLVIVAFAQIVVRYVLTNVPG